MLLLKKAVQLTIAATALVWSHILAAERVHEINPYPANVEYRVSS
jgi:hypothetical protein